MFGPFSSAELFELTPLGILLFGAVAVAILAGFREDENRFGLIAAVALVSVLATQASIFLIGESTAPFNGLLKPDVLAKAFASLILLFLFLAIMVRPQNGTPIARRPGSYLSLLLFSAMGALCLVFGNDLLFIFVGLELLSLPLYVMTAMSTHKGASYEASFKYFLLGAMASAFFIFGVALLWGSTGTFKMDEMGRVLVSGSARAPILVVLGSAMLLSGMAFKLALVPFHMWLPDVYDAAPSPLVAWMSGAVKASIAAVAFRFCGSVLAHADFQWQPVLVWLSIFSMVWGSFAALNQKSVKRMLAYSSIAHAGFMAMALVCAVPGSLREAGTALVFYILVYGLASLACFLILAVEEKEGRTRITDLKGLAKRRPGLALAFAIALLSLAGLPPLGGFVGKFNLFALALKQGWMELVLVGVLSSVISLGYYLKLIVAAYMEESVHPEPLPFGWGLRGALGAAAILTVYLGIFPGTVVDFLMSVPSLLIP